MCGYVRRHIGTKALREFVDLIDMSKQFRHYENSEETTQHFYPAFGGASSRQILDLIIRQNQEIKTVNATWWFDCKEVDGKLAVGERTTFNARNLTSTFWKGAIRHHRGVVLATGLGEGKSINGKNVHYLMEGKNPLLLGAVYRPFPNALYSTAIITRDAHPRFSEYHEKAFPLFLPPDPEFLKLWLSEEPETHPSIAHLLENPKVFTPLEVTRVKTFKGGDALGETQVLDADP